MCRVGCLAPICDELRVYYPNKHLKTTMNTHTHSLFNTSLKQKINYLITKNRSSTSKECALGSFRRTLRLIYCVLYVCARLCVCVCVCVCVCLCACACCVCQL